ncbi:MAG TPA: BMC domain-containing protein [candidate division Zixibacteria bacterium]|nr:BMC domain-containing protein [candidate division Zixibacteria bacterium]
MSDKALGLIETKGLIGAIEAVDAAAKAAAVVVSSVELTEAAFMTLKIEGDLGAVQAAVEAGASAAEKIGELVAVHVIPNPSGEMAAILPRRRYVSKYHPDDMRPALTDSDAEAGLPIQKKKQKNRRRVTKQHNITETQNKIIKTQLDKMTVSELRQIARKLVNLTLKGREISMANKQQLIDAIRRVEGMEE